MLSRSNSNAGERLRRAKSTSSTHTSSSGRPQNRGTNDPFLTRQQAEAAAVEAYHRAQAYQETIDHAYRLIPPKLERRRSRVSGKEEGSHFENARLGRRKSKGRRDENAIAKSSQGTPPRTNESSSEVHGEEGMITRRRSVIPPNPSARFSQSEQSVPYSSRAVRKSQSGYSDGSPLPRHTSTLKERSSTLQLHAPRLDRSSGETTNVFQPPGLDPLPEVTDLDVQRTGAAVRHRQVDEEALAGARDRCLQDFQQKKLRERKSFILAPFQKRRATNVPSSNDTIYDNSLPPFNYADQELPPPPPPPPPPSMQPVPVISLHEESNTRKFSDSLKVRIKKVFRKTSRAPSGLPAQHVEGRSFHFSISSPMSTPRISSEKGEDPFTVADHRSHLVAQDTKPDSSSSKHSACAKSTTKSRMTSWNTSTAAGTWSTRPGDEYEDSSDEHGRLKRSDSVSTLRKARSFFGRPVKNRLHRRSKAELTSSEESTGLYSALQERINPTDSTSQRADNNESAPSETSSAIAELPSQQRASSTFGSKSRWAVPTIRSDNPDSAAFQLDIPSPVTEVFSPDAARPPSQSNARSNGEQSGATPRIRLQRRPAVKAPTPSKELLARRTDKSKNRWQSPLDELSSPVVGPTKAAMIQDNPYELRSLSRTLREPVAIRDLPHHARVAVQPGAARQNVLSPSIYSRGTDEASPRPDTPVEQGGMLVTITGHEVRSYSISPKKTENSNRNPVQVSKDWRRWLSDEMHIWNDATAQADFALPTTVSTVTKPTEANVRVVGQVAGQGHPDKRLESVSPPLEAIPIDPRPQRVRPRSRHSGYMNERYPIIDANRDSSDKSVKSTQQRSSRTDSRIDNASSNLCDNSASGVGSKSGIARQRMVSKHRSLAQLGATAHNNSALNQIDTGNGGIEPDDAGARPLGGTGPAPFEPSMKTAGKAKSAFNLRANYRISTKGKAKPFAVHRRTETASKIEILDDSTIQNISAGPYASQRVASNLAAANTENTSPSEVNSLPALSSSGWLAAGTNKKRDASKPLAVHPARINRSVSRYTPARTTITPPGGGGGSSPGQRLATNWLDGKRSKENSPAFV